MTSIDRTLWPSLDDLRRGTVLPSMLNFVVLAKRSPLGEALTNALGEFSEVTSATNVAPVDYAATSHVLLAPVSACAPETCIRLAQLGRRVVLIAPVSRDAEQSRYLASGATGYLPVSVRPDELRRAVSAAAGEPYVGITRRGHGTALRSSRSGHKGGTHASP